LPQPEPELESKSGPRSKPEAESEASRDESKDQPEALPPRSLLERVSFHFGQPPAPVVIPPPAINDDSLSNRAGSPPLQRKTS
jgi:hypothetical protein